MTQPMTVSQDEKVLAGLAHGSILLGAFTSGIGGIVAALVIWLTQKDKSAYTAFQALQALVYQVAVTLLTFIAWCCWGFLWMAMFLPQIMSNPEAYQNTPPSGMWIGMFLMVIPLAIWGLTILYGLWGAVRCLGGHDFEYVVVGKWLASNK
jgi:uncharacterized Tic20 family protein